MMVLVGPVTRSGSVYRRVLDLGLYCRGVDHGVGPGPLKIMQEGSEYVFTL